MHKVTSKPYYVLYHNQYMHAYIIFIIINLHDILLYVHFHVALHPCIHACTLTCHVTLTMYVIIYYILLHFRMLVTHIPMFTDQSTQVTWHIQHKYYEEMFKKSEIVCLLTLCLIHAGNYNILHLYIQL